MPNASLERGGIQKLLFGLPYRRNICMNDNDIRRET